MGRWYSSISYFLETYKIMEKNHGLIFIYGTMCSGKSAQLQLKAHNFEERKVPFIIIKSSITCFTAIVAISMFFLLYHLH